MKSLGYVYAGLLVRTAGIEITEDILRKIFKTINKEVDDETISQVVRNKHVFDTDFFNFKYIELPAQAPEPEPEPTPVIEEEDDPVGLVKLFG